MSQAIPLKVKQLGEILMRCPQRDLESIVRVVVHAPGSVGGTPSAAVIGAQFGFDWDSGSLLISTDEKLTRLSPEDVLAINDSVRKGASWHAYQSWKKQEDRITALEASHLEELRAYELTVRNLRAELESVRQGQCLHKIAEPAAPQAVQPVAYLRFMAWQGSGSPETGPEYDEGFEVCTPSDKGSDGSAAFPVYTRPTPQGLDAELVAFIEKVRDFKAQAVRVGAIDGSIRWDIEYGHYGAEVRAKTLSDAIAKALAAQAKQGEKANG